MTLSVGALAGLLVSANPAAKRVVWYDLSTAGDTLVATVQIQLARIAELVDGPELPPHPLGDRIGIVRADLIARRATLGIWVESSSIATTPEVVMFVVGDRDDRAFVEALAASGPFRPDLERELAVKLRNVVTSLLVRTRSAAIVDTKPSPSPSTTFRFSLEAGGLGTLGDGDGGPQAGLMFAVGGRMESSDWLLELRTGARLATNREVDDASRGRIEIGEWAWNVGARVLGAFDRVRAGGALDLQLRILDANGRTPLGVPGESTLVLPSLVLGPELRVAMIRSLEIRALIGAGLNLERRRLALNDAPLFDLGIWFGTAELSFVFSVP